MKDIIGRNIGRYHVIEKLGEGGMASVYKAFDTHLERDVALKIILPTFQHSESFLIRFEREAKSLAQLAHSNIVPVIDYGDIEGLPYLVMIYLPGGTLKQRMGLPLPADEVAWLLAPIAGALHYAHQYGIIHRDVKPANVLLTETGQPMLSDFGIAKLLESKDDSNLTITGLSIGTPDYMSPEQGQGKPVDARTDIYALGIVLYEMVVGRKPYRADTPMAVIVKHMTEPLPRPRSFRPDLPEAVERVIFKALAKKPDDRYTDMHAFQSALERLARGKDVTGTNIVPGEQPVTQVAPGVRPQVDDGTSDHMPPGGVLPGVETRVSDQPLPDKEIVKQAEPGMETEVDDGKADHMPPRGALLEVENRVSDQPLPEEEIITQVEAGIETEVDDGTVDHMPPSGLLPGMESRVSDQPLQGEEIVTQVEPGMETEVDDGTEEHLPSGETLKGMETRVLDQPMPPMSTEKPVQSEKRKTRKVPWPIIASGFGLVGIAMIVVLVLVFSQFIGGDTEETPTNGPASAAQVVTKTLVTTKFVMENPPESLIETSTPEIEEEAVVEEVDEEDVVSVIMLTDNSIDSVPLYVSALRGFDRARADFDVIMEILEGTENPAVNEENLQFAVQEDFDLIILMAWGFQDLVNEIAPVHPDKFFVCIECFAEQPNVLNIGYKTHELAYLLGVAAGLMTEANVVATVGNVETPVMARWTIPFGDEAKYINPEVTILPTLWVGGWDDPEHAKELAIILAEQGADIINGVASRGNTGIFAAAEDHGLRVFGVDNNECPLLPGYIIDSNIKRYDISVYNSIQAFVTGDLTTGGRYDYGLADGGVDLAVFAFENEDTQCILVDYPEVIQVVREVRQKIIDGELVIPDPMLSE